MLDLFPALPAEIVVLLLDDLLCHKLEFANHFRLGFGQEGELLFRQPALLVQGFLDRREAAAKIAGFAPSLGKRRLRAFEALPGLAMSRLRPAERFRRRGQLPFGRRLGLAQQTRLANPFRQRLLQLADPRGLLLFQQEPPLQFDIRRSEWFDAGFAQTSRRDRHAAAHDQGNHQYGQDRSGDDESDNISGGHPILRVYSTGTLARRVPFTRAISDRLSPPSPSSG